MSAKSTGVTTKHENKKAIARNYMHAVVPHVPRSDMRLMPTQVIAEIMSARSQTAGLRPRSQGATVPQISMHAKNPVAKKLEKRTVTLKSYVNIIITSRTRRN